MNSYDVVVIGGGAAGLTAAITAKGFGKTVLLIEKNKLGGECTWSGCIPSKALINYAKEIHTVKKHVADFFVDKNKPFERVNEVIQHVYAEETPEKMEEIGIRVLKGSASFVSKEMIEVDGVPIQGKHYFIATGSKPVVPKIQGLESVDYLTNESIFTLEKLPESLLIVGTGAIGLELAQAMNRLGVRVTVLGRSKGILKKEDKTLSSKLMEILISEGVQFKTGIQFKEISKGGEGVTLKIEEAGKDLILNADKILFATGRKSSLESLGLEKAGINYTKKCITVNGYLQTSNPKVYAIGDVAGPYQFSHMANVQGIKAVQNALLPLKRKINYDHVAWCTFTDPELASAGMTEEVAKEIYGDVQVYTYDYSQLDRVKTIPGSDGLIKVILNKKGKVLGASILGERAGELISEVQVLKTLGLPYKKLVNVIHPYPTYGEALNKISKSVAVDALLNHPVVKLFRKGD
jgi:pyruvate/2-oxoglutarate dehydrogenase complex dihydrolipoamide dehydrogenase (E3) component